jgi:hypothetical protein
MTRKVTRKPVARAATNIADTLRQFLSLRVQSEALDERLGTLKKDLTTAVETAGYEDDKGNFWLDLDEPVDVDGFGSCVRLKKERRVRVGVDETAAEALLKAKGLYEDCTAQITVLDEEEIRKAHFKGLLTDEEIDQIFPATATWAFKPEKAR